MIPVILCGGTGSRLWPLSREAYPKQFLSLTGSDTMLQATALRLDGIEEVQAPIVVCNEEHRFAAAEQLQEIGHKAQAILLEPCARNTAPAIALAALAALETGADPLLLVLPADHMVADVAAFQRAVAEASALAEAGHLVTFGIVPTRAETGYGYIRRGEAVGEGGWKVAEFVEKPDAATAERYLADGGYAWNSGIFLFRAARYIEELGQHQPEILDACRAAFAGAARDLDFTRVDAEAFSSCPEDSVDYAVMEKTESAAVVPMDAGWSDVGSWSALWELSERDDDDNLLHGDALAEDSSGCLVRADSRLVGLLGVRDLVVVDTDDALLIADKQRVQEVKRLVQRLNAASRSETRRHRKVYRPWGYYDSIDAGPRFQVKRIVVKPGRQLSLQMHHHRAEHWIVVRGTAKVTRGDEELLVTENQSTYIPLGVVHRLENPGTIPLELIEVQSGSYLGEDDIVRFDDSYGRV
ncbi:mannose-1-phosphate guanylyltransferase/mannose-6-phosphate isomerase [Microbulbifer thermotolerans]|uniref:mannose-1-phosphate guanylyltransferase n=1 Tax=Microbulbifer thermotolerans TaxID=252514 RepID=A0A143HIS3_MICTH|nr:mannose-1-phosphate guanylyltransferase/mannose-6-phosphate isomerase [Microbulbifer thermotolerans]AMX01618.1 mannose-1-phosphate guanylyltransferase/mannose-6-phosphate isomerase [Microbulbifer thermotolerans]MCX2780222.1 mannose-1-phosphate guanylyltransferase/mannose-6-phosphate isomerase [Microbulbifer thermotolerans]MCX2783846.1 mannose-1-phosphate guanylyltransferase/mannose-6-phosphate isomerase [Microbulbifer thermotolerans]MCX2795953.1 mannose-1-phosphate guanylyltransferase/mannos